MSGGREPSLERLVLATREALVLEGVAECLVCGGALRATGGCEDCGSELS